MPTAAAFDFSTSDKKKAAIAGAISFNEASGTKYSKTKLIEHFGISPSTFYAWFPIENSTTGRPRQEPKAPRKKDESPTLKRNRPEDLEEETLDSHEPHSKRQYPAQNGRGHKQQISTPPSSSPPASTSSLSPPQQLPTPQKRRGRQPNAQKQHVGQPDRRNGGASQGTRLESYEDVAV